MKKILLLFIVVLLSCSSNSDERETFEPPENIGYLSFVNDAAGWVTFTEISFQGHRFELDSRTQRFEVDTEILSRLGEITITLSYEDQTGFPFKKTTKAVFVESRTTNIRAFVENQSRLVFEVTYS